MKKGEVEAEIVPIKRTIPRLLPGNKLRVRIRLGAETSELKTYEVIKEYVHFIRVREKGKQYIDSLLKNSIRCGEIKIMEVGKR